MHTFHALHTVRTKDVKYSQDFWSRVAKDEAANDHLHTSFFSPLTPEFARFIQFVLETWALNTVKLPRQPPVIDLTWFKEVRYRFDQVLTSLHLDPPPDTKFPGQTEGVIPP